MRERLTDKKATVNYDDLKVTTPVLKTAAAAGAGRREIPEDFKYNAKKLKHLKAILHNVSVALGTLTSAFGEFSKFKGPDVSPDGRLGGAGYILNLKDIKQTMQSSIHSLSDIADCLADEMTNPRWDTEDDKEVKKLIKEKDDAKEDAEEKIEEEGIDPKDVADAPSEEEPEEKPEEQAKEEEKPEEVPEGGMVKEVPSIKEPVQITNERSASSSLDQAVRQSLMNFIS